MTIHDMSALVRAGGLTGYETLMQSLGVDPLPLLQRHGITPTMLVDVDALIPLHATLDLLEESAAVARCTDLGLRLCRNQDPSVLGLLAIVIQNAPTVAQAIADCSRYLFLHSTAFEIALDTTSPLFADSALLRFDIRLPVPIPRRQGLDQSIGLMFRTAQILSAGKLRFRAVSLPHRPLADEKVYRRFFGVPVYFSQPYAGLHAHYDDLQADLTTGNPAVRQLALDYIARHITPRTLGVADRVRQILERTLGTIKGTKTEVADLLGIHPRTLQRHLNHEGKSFETLREEVYKAAALRYLCETNLPLKQLAGALGFSEQSAFTRACGRWFSASPSQIRAGNGHK